MEDKALVFVYQRHPSQYGFSVHEKVLRRLDRNGSKLQRQVGGHQEDCPT
jgi:hypothetical protein